MRKPIAVLIVVLSIAAASFSQDKNALWKGNKLYKERQYPEAQELYQSSLELKPSEDANFNMANALYKQKKYTDAAKLFESVAGKTEDKKLKAEAYHNLGNSYLKSKELDKGIEAYKSALRNNPGDEETRYNLSYALQMKQEQEKQDQDKEQNKDQNEDENQEKKENQDKQDQQNDKEKENEEQDKKDQNRDQQDERDEQQQEQQPQPNEISKEDAERLLENLENEEEKTKEKVQMKQRKSSNVKIENDW